MTNNKKVTKRDYLAMIKEVVLNADVDNRDELVAFIEKEDAALAKKKSVSAKKQAQMDAEVEEMFEVLSRMENPVTASELAREEEFAAKAYSLPKVSALLKKLVDAGRVVRVTEKKKSYFSVAA